MKSSHSHYIIRSAKNLPVLVQIRDVVLTILVWLMYIYFMRTFFVFVGDFVDWVSNGFVNGDSYASFTIIPTIVFYIEVILVMEVVYVAWSFYNLVRFGRKTRRRDPVPVSAEEIAKRYNIDAKDVGKWQKAHIMTMHHDRKGHLVEVETN